MQQTLQTGDIYPKRNVIASFVLKRKGTIIEFVSALFILLFLYTALTKSLNINKTVEVLRRLTATTHLANEIAWGVVIAEYIIAFLLFLPKTRKIGLYASVFLMASFTIYILFMIAFVPHLPCSCGGIISSLGWNSHLALNLFLIALGSFGIYLVRKKQA